MLFGMVVDITCMLGLLHSFVFSESLQRPTVLNDNIFSLFLQLLTASESELLLCYVKRCHFVTLKVVNPQKGFSSPHCFTLTEASTERFSQ